MEVETLAAEIQTGVQHRNGPPLDSSQSTSWSLSLGRPFFMAFLTMRSFPQPVATHGNGSGLFEPAFARSDLRPVATGRNHGVHKGSIRRCRFWATRLHWPLPAGSTSL